MNPFPAYLHSQLEEKLKDRRVVVWYDAAREFEPFVDSLPKGDGELPEVMIGTTNARLALYQGSYFALKLQVEPLVAVNRPQPLLLYLAGERREPKGSVLMELEKAGATYEPQMKRLARNVMRKFFSDGVIDEMLAPESLTYPDMRRYTSHLAARACCARVSVRGPAAIQPRRNGRKRPCPTWHRWAHATMAGRSPCRGCDATQAA